MSYYRLQIFFYLGMGLLVLFHMDLWAWDRLQPLIGGMLPYEMWYRGLLTLGSLGLFLWLGARAWPEPPPGCLEPPEEEEG